MRYHVYVSACRGTSSDAENTAELRATLDRAGLPHVACEGVYQGTREASFKVLCEDSSEVLICYFAAHRYDQDCILVVDTIEICYQFISCSATFQEQFNGDHWTKGGLYPVLSVEGDHTMIGGLPYQLIDRL